MEKLCLISFVSFLSGVSFLQSCLAEDIPINGNISVVLQNLGVDLFVLNDAEIIRHVKYLSPNSPVLRPPCRTCDPTYNQFPMDNRYLIPDNHKMYVVNPNSMTPPTEIDIGNCNPVHLYSVKSNVIWVQCSLDGGLFEVVELRTADYVTWYRHGNQNIEVSSGNSSRNGLVLVKEKDGENVTFLYYGNGGILERKGLKESSVGRYIKPSSQCTLIEELFYINDELILIYCILKDTSPEHGLVLFNTSNPSQPLALFHRFYNRLMKVHVFEDYIVLISNDTLIIRNVIRFKDIEQLIPFPPELSTSGIFVKLEDTIYFVCTSKKNIYFVDIDSVLHGNLTAYRRIGSREEICTEVTCSPMQYVEQLLFVPLKTNELAIYTLDPIKLHTTANILTGHYRYFYTPSPTMPEIPLATSSTVENENNNNLLATDEPLGQSRSSDGLSSGGIAGITIAVVVLILSIIIVIIVWYRYRKQHSSRYYHYQAAVVTFERTENSQDEEMVIVPGRFDNPIWSLNDNSASAEDESNAVSGPASPLNNQFATNVRKKKNTNATGGHFTAPSNIDYNVDNDNGSENSYGFETRQEPVDRQQYFDSLVIGTLPTSII